MILYTDGSQEYDQTGSPSGTGAEWVIEGVKNWFSKGGAALGTTQEIYDSEVYTMTRGLGVALKAPMAQHASAIHICLDNFSVAKNAGKILEQSSQATFIKFRELAKTWLAKEGNTMTVQWIPGREGIKGNPTADTEARVHARAPVNPPSCNTQSLSNARRQIRKSKDVAWQLEWENQRQNWVPLLYLELGLKLTSKRKKLAPRLSMRREVLGWLTAARSEHGHFAAYHQRFSHEEEEDWRCFCGRYRPPLHPFGCTNARAHRALLWSEKTKRALSAKEILSTIEGAAAFAKWTLETGLFNLRFGVREQGGADP